MPEINNIPININSPSYTDESEVNSLDSQPGLSTENTFENSTVNKFNQAFAESSPIVQQYITNEKLTEDIELICKIEKLNNQNSQTIIENISVSILVGLLTIPEAKNVLLESFKASGIVLSQIEVINIMNDIDKYILSNVRKQILDDNLKKTKVIKHLTLKEREEAVTTDELRKILLDRTGNLTGQSPIFQYKKTDILQPKPLSEQEMSKKNQAFDRESLLKSISGLADEQSVNQRMDEIKKEVEQKITPAKPADNPSLATSNLVKSVISTPNDSPDTNLSYVFAERLKDQLNAHSDKNIDLDKLRQERGEAESENLNKQKTDTAYARATQSDQNSDDKEDPDFDPYRETL